MQRREFLRNSLVLGSTGLLKRGKEPLTEVAAMVRGKPKKFLKRLGFLN